jgi:hypothetical protein
LNRINQKKEKMRAFVEKESTEIAALESSIQGYTALLAEIQSRDESPAEVVEPVAEPSNSDIDSVFPPETEERNGNR